MTMTLEHAMSDADEDQQEFDENAPRLCACGCGEPLREGAKRDYKRGHRIRAEGIEPDPEPGEEAKKRTVRATTRIKTEMRETIEAYLAMAAATWALSDPYCGNAVLEATPRIAEKLVPILSKNQAFIRYFQTSNSFREGMDLFLVLLPVLRTISAHHFFHTIGDVEQGEVPNYNGYVA